MRTAFLLSGVALSMLGCSGSGDKNVAPQLPNIGAWSVSTPPAVSADGSEIDLSAHLVADNPSRVTVTWAPVPGSAASMDLSNTTGSTTKVSVPVVGNYQVLMTAKDDRGNSTSSLVSISVSPDLGLELQGQATLAAQPLAGATVTVKWRDRVMPTMSQVSDAQGLWVFRGLVGDLSDFEFTVTAP